MGLAPAQRAQRNDHLPPAHLSADPGQHLGRDHTALAHRPHHAPPAWRIRAGAAADPAVALA